jgi:hypothetical protein
MRYMKKSLLIYIGLLKEIRILLLLLSKIKSIEHLFK